jgi:allantoin racemase
MHMASLIGNSFSVVTTLERTVGMAWHLAERYGMRHACRNVHASDLPVLDLEKPGSNARQIILEACRSALAQDRSDCIVLGCAGMADLCEDLSAELHVPVIDGVVAAVKLVEALVGMRLSTSKRGDWARPLPKPYTGMLAPFALA